MSTLLFIDPQTGEQLYYDELLNGVCAGSIDYAPWVQPSTHCEAVRALLTAVVLGQPLTFFDSDFSVVERESLGGTAVRLAERIRLPGGSWSDSDAMRSKALQQTGFALTLFTSGTTGRPKQVTHDVEGLTRMLKVSVVHESNVWGLAYNSTHIAGVQVILQAFFNGNILVNLFTASRETIVGALGNYKVSHISATPSFYRLLLPISRSVPSVRAVSLGGEPSDENLIKQCALLFPQRGFAIFMRRRKWALYWSRRAKYLRSRRNIRIGLPCVTIDCGFIGVWWGRWRLGTKVEMRN